MERNRESIMKAKTKKHIDLLDGEGYQIRKIKDNRSYAEMVNCHTINILACLKWAVKLDSTNEGKNFHMIEAAHKSAQEISKLKEKE
tara:strand:- start:29 stop:289 length:261 start_codon:yes stop_codon:yes gene_type:complete